MCFSLSLTSTLALYYPLALKWSHIESLGLAPALLGNTRLGWIILADCDKYTTELNMFVKSFMTQAPGFQLCVKIFVLFQFSQNFFFFVSQMLKVSSRVWLKNVLRPNALAYCGKFYTCVSSNF